MKKFKLGLVLGVLLIGAMGQASLVCQGYTANGKLIPVKATILLHALRAIGIFQGETTLSVGTSQHEFNSTYFEGNASTRCIAGPTLSSTLEGELAVNLFTYSGCDPQPPPSMGQTDYHGSITVKNPNGTGTTFNVGCKYVDDVGKVTFLL